MCKVAILTCGLPAEPVCVRLCVCVWVFAFLWWKFLQHKGPFIIARMRDWHCLVSVCLYVHVCIQTEVESERSAQPGTQILKAYLCVCVWEREWREDKWTRQRLMAQQRDRMTKTDRGLYVPAPVSLYKESHVAIADLKSFGKSPSWVSSHSQHAGASLNWLLANTHCCYSL